MRAGKLGRLILPFLAPLSSPCSSKHLIAAPFPRFFSDTHYSQPHSLTLTMPLDPFECHSQIRREVNGGRMKEAVQMFQQMGKEVQKSSHVAALLVDGYSRLGQAKEAWELFEHLRGKGLAVDVPVFNSLLSAFANHAKMEDAHSLFRELTTSGLQPNIRSYNALVGGYTKMGQLQEATFLFHEMKKMNIQPNLVTYNFLVEGLVAAGEMEKAYRWVEKMKEEKIQPDEFTYVILAEGYVKRGQREEAEMLRKAMMDIDYLEEEGEIVDIGALNKFIDALARIGEMNEARRVLKKVEDSGLVPNKASYLSLVVGFEKLGEMDNVAMVLKEMKEKGFDVEEKDRKTVVSSE